MIDKLREHVEFLFMDAPHSPRAVELKEELIANLIDRYTDLIQQGKQEDEAYSIVIAGIGDVDELIRGLREQEVWNPANIQAQQQKSAILVSIAIGIYIVSFIFPAIFYNFIPSPVGPILSIIFLFSCWAVATAMLIYNAMSKPKYVKIEETIVEDFKEWKTDKVKADSFQKLIQSIIWTATVPIYLIIGVFFNAWHPGWLIFVLAPIVSQILRLIYAYKQMDGKEN